MDPLVQQILLAGLNGLVVGLTLALVASGLALIFGVMDIVNFAHGDLSMLGGYVVWLGVSWTGSFLVAFVGALVTVGLLGTIVFSLAVAPLLGRHPLYTALSTLGLGLMLREGALRIFGGDAKVVETHFDRSVRVLGVDYPLYRLVVIAISAALIALVWLYLERGRYGLWIRAVAQDRAMASVLGVKIPVVYLLVFGASATMAAMGGALLAPITNVFPTVGLEMLLPAFVVVVAGGMGNIRGAAVISVVLGELESLGSLLVKPTLARTLAFAMLMGYLMVRRRPSVR